MSDNPFADAIATPPSRGVTHEVTNHPHFFQGAIDQKKRELQARNMTRQDMFNNGFLSVEDLDDEELRTGKCRDASGRIAKNPNKTEMVPRDLYDEMVAEHLRRTQENYRQQLDYALGVFADCMVDPTAEWKDRMEAAKYITERVAGKTPERVNVSVTKAPWEELLGDVAHVTRAQHERMKAGAIDAEVVDLADEPNPTEPQGRTADGYVEADAHEPSTDYLDGYVQHVAPWSPPEPAPSHDMPASSNPVAEITLSESIRQAQEDALRVAEARANRTKLVNDAKRKRKAQRAMGQDVLRRNINAEAFGNAQDRFAAEVPDTEDETSADTP